MNKVPALKNQSVPPEPVPAREAASPQVQDSSASDVSIEAAPLTDKQAIEQLHAYLGTTTPEELVSLVKTLNENLASVEVEKRERMYRPITMTAPGFHIDPVAVQQQVNRIIAMEPGTLAEAISPLLANQDAIQARLMSCFEDQQANLRLVIRKYREVPPNTPVTKEDAELFAKIWSQFGSKEWSNGVPCARNSHGEMVNHPWNFKEIHSWLDQLECDQAPSYLRIRE
jgi:hypothetical protein